MADLHIGKRLNEFSMIEDQRHVLDQIIEIIKAEEVDGILIAGDVYDKSQPTVEAVELFDDFLTTMSETGIPIFIISGNHDSPERLNFGKRILEKNNLYIGGVFEGALEKITLKDEYGNYNIYMLPFVKPIMVRPYFQQVIESYDDAVHAVIESAEIDQSERNILVAHQFVIGGLLEPERTDSENISVGGIDNVHVEAFDAFDYVALGHLHSPQKIGRNEVRYAGSPLKYSFSEVKHVKSVTIINMKEKGEVTIEKVPLSPLYDMREVKGPIVELIRLGSEEQEGREDYIHAIVTDEEEVYDAIGRLRQVYPNLMTLEFHNSKTAETVSAGTMSLEKISEKNIYELFQDFYLMQNNAEFSQVQQKFIMDIIEDAGGRVL